MTDNFIPQTSASDRYEAARKALAAFEANEDKTFSGHDIPAEARVLADALRTLITPPHNHESLSDLALKIHTAALNAAEDAGITITTDLDSIMRNATNRAVYAGMQRAHEVWEPEVALRPTQEQMLRWLGIDCKDSEDDEGNPSIYVYAQHIEREDD